MTHAEHTPGRSTCPGNLTVTRHLNRRSGVFTVYRCDQCGWTNDPRRRQQTDGAKPVQIGATATMKTMRLSLNRKAGAPNYGSDGAGMELEIELSDDTGMSGLPEIALTYYAMMEHTLQLQLERMSSRHTDAGAARPAEPAAAAVPPRGRRPEPTADDYDPEPARREPPAAEAPRRNPAPPAGGNGNGRGKPKSGRELIGWANGQGKYDSLLAIANRIKRGRIVDWDQDLVDWAYNDLSRPVGAGWGDGRN